MIYPVNLKTHSITSFLYHPLTFFKPIWRVQCLFLFYSILPFIYEELHTHHYFFSDYYSKCTFWSILFWILCLRSKCESPSSLHIFTLLWINSFPTLFYFFLFYFFYILTLIFVILNLITHLFYPFFTFLETLLHHTTSVYSPNAFFFNVPLCTLLL